MAERKVTYRNDGAIKRTAVWEDDDPLKIHIYTEQDLTQAIENNKILSELHPSRSTNKLVARGVPVSVYEKSILENWDSKDWARWLDDPDNRAFRVWPGRVGK
jgi:hypothetical protein